MSTETTEADGENVRRDIFDRVKTAIIAAPDGDPEAQANGAIVALLQALADYATEEGARQNVLGICGWLRR